MDTRPGAGSRRPGCPADRRALRGGLDLGGRWAHHAPSRALPLPLDDRRSRRRDPAVRGDSAPRLHRARSDAPQLANRRGGGAPPRRPAGTQPPADGHRAAAEPPPAEPATGAGGPRAAGTERAAAQLEAHERVREAARAKGRVSIEPVLPVDILGAYVLLPRLS